MKNKIALPLLLIALLTSQAQAGIKLSDAQKALLYRQTPSTNGGFIDSDRETNTSDTQGEKVISEKTPEDFGSGSAGVRFSELVYKYNKEAGTNTLSASTSTFDGDYLRSTTYCAGSVATGKVTGSRMVYCATASQNACQNVLESVRRQKARDPNLADTKKALACVDTLKNYSEILGGYTELMDKKPRLANVRGELVAQEGQAMKKILGKLSTDAYYTTTNINELSSKAQIEEVAAQLSSTTGGLLQIAKFIDLCERNQRSWNAKLADPNPPRLEMPKPKAAGGTN